MDLTIAVMMQLVQTLMGRFIALVILVIMAMDSIAQVTNLFILYFFI